MNSEKESKRDWGWRRTQYFVQPLDAESHDNIYKQLGENSKSYVFKDSAGAPKNVGFSLYSVPLDMVEHFFERKSLNFYLYTRKMGDGFPSFSMQSNALMYQRNEKSEESRPTERKLYLAPRVERKLFPANHAMKVNDDIGLPEKNETKTTDRKLAWFSVAGTILTGLLWLLAI